LSLGAVGNFNAHLVAYPDVDWMQFSKEIIDVGVYSSHVLLF
jgi:hypothetical protein